MRRQLGRATVIATAAGLFGVVVASAGGPDQSVDQPATASAVAQRISPPGGPTTLGGCSVFPADNPWNTPVAGLPLRAGSAATISRILSIKGQGPNLHPDFGENPDYGIPFVIVPASQPLVPISYDGAGDQSDQGPMPIPLDAPIEGGGDGDSHVLVLQQGTCRLFELYDAQRTGDGWSAYSGAEFNLSTNALRPLGWTSADAAGLPILPGLVRYDEVASGVITHAIRMTFDETQDTYILPATHEASSRTDADLPPMGLRLRLSAGYDISHLTGQARVIAVALQQYGVIVADNGSNWYFQGAPDPRWNDDDLDQLKSIPGSAFEVVDTGPANP
ncbi:MAG TPA: hypothetical protein VGM78_11185 [Ilumatobacteraceae bacterium]